jgi:hypothetical protein
VRARAVKANSGADLSDAATLKQLAQSGKIEDLAIHWLVRACLLKELNCHDAAEALYERMGVLEKLSLVKSETWVFPWTLFDYASLKYAQNDLDAAKALLDRVQKFSDFSFEYRLYLRAHLLTKAVEEKQDRNKRNNDQQKKKPNNQIHSVQSNDSAAPCVSSASVGATDESTKNRSPASTIALGDALAYT